LPQTAPVADLELCYTPAIELARQLRERRRSSVEVVENALARCADLQPTLNCFTELYGDEALAAAREADRGTPSGRLHGVPFALKDLTPTRGHLITYGSHAFDERPASDAIVAARLRAAGGILVARTTTPELAYSSFTLSPRHGVTRNPYDPARTPGGSSGGSGAAVASGCVAVAEGSDMGGSIRIPASWCGVVGLKPSFGRIPLEFLPSPLDHIHHVGPLARTVADTRLFMAATQGPDDRDLLSLPDRLDLDGPLSDEVRGLRLALSIDLGCYQVDAEIEAAVRRAAGALRDAGATVDEVEVGFDDELLHAWEEHWDVYLAHVLGDRLEPYGERLDPALRRRVERGWTRGAVEHRIRFDAAVRRAWERLRAVHEDHDALLCPTMALPPPRAEGERSEAEYDMTEVFNLTSPCPALSVPCGFTADGLPIGLQVVARRHRDDVALQVGAAVERALGGFQRPPL
jgi:Asp-tRNA(Asn)/Glu-tRNA(Gln) amidotransferase A subunit family amidase